MHVGFLVVLFLLYSIYFLLHPQDLSKYMSHSRQAGMKCKRMNGPELWQSIKFLKLAEYLNFFPASLFLSQQPVYKHLNLSLNLHFVSRA